MADGFWRTDEHRGDHYTLLLALLHDVLKPRSYLEIGTLNGDTLALARCPSVAIDPGFQLSKNVMQGKSTCFLAQMESDRFFESYDAKTLLGGEVDIAFLDGMHLYEYLVRDFINTEKFCKKKSVIFIHDCLPPDAFVARRNAADRQLETQSAHPEWWAGDVWKALLILRQARPELRIIAFDAAPTGLVAVTNLDPCSDVLTRGYFPLIDSVRNVSMDDIGAENFRKMMNYTSTASAADAPGVAQFFWL